MIDVAALLRPEQSLAPIGDGVWSVLGEPDRAASYDAIARSYDMVVGNGVYNRIVWGCPPRTYQTAAANALAAAGGAPVLDCGCGSLVFTHKVYLDHADQLLLFDRSLAMMARGKARLPAGIFVQGDALAMPFTDGAFDHAVAWGFLHVVGTASPLLGELARALSPGGRLTLSTLITGARQPGTAMLGLLHRNGEASMPETADHVRRAIDPLFVIDRDWRAGSMLFVSLIKR